MIQVSLKKRYLLPVVMLVATAGCDRPDTGAIVVDSANKDSRVAVVVIHHTSEDFKRSLDILTEPSDRPVSSHYLLPEPGDSTYSGNQLKVHELVPENQRAWHAGSSYWKGLAKLNNISIGIELVNQTYCHRPESMPDSINSDWPQESICFYPDFAESQIEMLIELLDGIVDRHTEVKPTHIIGHSDIAPQRKIDPGPRFPWQRLYKLGYGAWYNDETVIRYWQQFQQQMPSLALLQQALHTYGYKIEQTGHADEQTRNVLRAFQMHFLPWRVTGQADVDTAAVLYALIEKYYEPELGALLSVGAEISENTIKE